MENNYSLIRLTKREKEKIERQLQAFCYNFNKGITIYKRIGYYKGDIIYKIYIGNIKEEELINNEYIYQVESIEELKGWLYGMVQANNGYLKAFKGDNE